MTHSDDDRDRRNARRRRWRASRKYRPEVIRLLIVAEGPPASSERYFYFERVAEHDSLFRYVVSSILHVEPSRKGKAQFLQQLKEKGVFLADLSLDPVGESDIERRVGSLIGRLRRLQPERIILVKATVYDAAYRRLCQAKLPVVDERIPFPGSGQQTRFTEAFARALRKKPSPACRYSSPTRG